MFSVTKAYEDLRGAELVAKFQHLCGIRKIQEEPDDNGKVPKEKIKITLKWLHYIFLFGTALGDEAFYSIFFTFWFWNVDGAVGRRVVLVWAICMYIGQGLKDIIRWPRPSTPPVVRMERKWELEYGMPSTHAIVGSAIPMTIIIFTSTRYIYPATIGVTVAISVCTLVCLSRLYLGMHTVLDILAGIALVTFLLPMVIPLVDNVDSFFFTHEAGGISLIAFGVFLCLIYPSGDRWTPARGDTYVILGSAVGLNLGAWANYQLGIISCSPPTSPPYAVMWPSKNMVMLAAIRQVLGLVILLVCRHAGKSLINKLIKKEEASVKPGIVTELFTKFLAYINVGFSATFVAANAFRLMGIERPSFHTEI